MAKGRVYGKGLEGAQRGGGRGDHGLGKRGQGGSRRGAMSMRWICTYGQGWV